jgi:hypothetical protein
MLRVDLPFYSHRWKVKSQNLPYLTTDLPHFIVNGVDAFGGGTYNIEFLIGLLICF